MISLHRLAIEGGAAPDAGGFELFGKVPMDDGSEIDDIEWSLGQIETVAGPVLADLEQRWPIDPEDKHKLAEFFGVQLVRSSDQSMNFLGRFGYMVANLPVGEDGLAANLDVSGVNGDMPAPTAQPGSAPS